MDLLPALSDKLKDLPLILVHSEEYLTPEDQVFFDQLVDNCPTEQIIFLLGCKLLKPLTCTLIQQIQDLLMPMSIFMTFSISTTIIVFGIRADKTIISTCDIEINAN